MAADDALGTDRRVQPLTVDEWPPEMGDVIAALFPPDTRHPLPTNDRPRPQGMNVLGVLGHHPQLVKAYHVFNGHVLYNTLLSERERELVILRVAHLRDCDYEWAQHAWFANDLGMTDDEIARVQTGAGEGWSARESAMLAAVDELITDARIGDDNWRQLSAELDLRTMMDLVFTVGAYDLLAMAFRTFDVELDPDLADVMRSWPR